VARAVNPVSRNCAGKRNWKRIRRTKAREGGESQLHRTVQLDVLYTFHTMKRPKGEPSGRGRVTIAQDRTIGRSKGTPNLWPRR